MREGRGAPGTDGGRPVPRNPNHGLTPVFRKKNSMRSTENSAFERWDRWRVPEACLIFTYESLVQRAQIVRF